MQKNWVLPKKGSHPSDSNSKKDKTVWAYTKFIKEYKYKKYILDIQSVNQVYMLVGIQIFQE